MSRPSTNHEIRDARKMRAGHATYREIGERLGRSMMWAYRHTKDVLGPKRREPASEETIETAKRMRRNGVPVKEVARKLKYKPDTVSKWTTGTEPYEDKRKHFQVYKDAQSGMSNKQLAESYGYKSANVVASILTTERRRQKEKRR